MKASIKKIIEIQSNFPKLTFQNEGYQYLSKEIKENHKKEIAEIESILRQEINGFSEFNNFKINKDGSISVRCQYYWDNSFKGVSYFNINEF
mgnify:FL=1